MKIIFNKIYDYLKNNIKYIIKDIIVIAIILFVAFYKFPYLIYKPGGTIDLSSRINIENAKENKGKYYMNYVSVSRGTLPAIISSYLVKNWDLVKEEEVTYDDMDYDTTFKIEVLQMKNSMDLSTLIAYQKADKKIDITKRNMIILAIDKKAKTNLKLLDEIISIDGENYIDHNELRKYINSKNIDDKVEFKLSNGSTRYAYVYENDNEKYIGISILNNYEYSTDPKIEITSKASEAGSSGGFMMTLAIYDELIDEDLTHGLNIMGTGTIEEDESIGEIGGVKYKMLGAEKYGADVFFVPEANYKEAKKVYKENNLTFDLVMVKNVDEAIDYLSNLK